MDKPVKRVDLSKLNPEQRQALGQFYQDCQTAASQVGEMQQAAQRIFREWLKTPQWTANEGQKPDEPPAEDLWHVKPEINYVDHIEGVS